MRLTKRNMKLMLDEFKEMCPDVEFASDEFANCFCDYCESYCLSEEQTIKLYEYMNNNY